MKTKELLKAIKYIMPGIDQNQLMVEGSDLITFENNWIRTYNGKLAISYPTELSLEFSVLAKPLYEVLNKVDIEDIYIEIDESQFLLRGTNKKLTLQYLKRNLEGSIFNLDKTEFKDIPKDFSEGVGLCAFSISKDQSLGILTGIYVGNNTILSSDNFRISHYEMEEKIEDKFILSPDCISYITKVNKITKYAIESSWVHFKFENGTILSSRLQDGKYKVKEILDILNIEELGEYTFPESTPEAIARAGILSGEDSLNKEFISIKKKKDELFIIGKREGIGEYEEKIPWESDFQEDISMEMNPDFLEKILKVTNLFVIDKDKKYVIFFTNNGAFEHLETMYID